MLSRLLLSGIGLFAPTLALACQMNVPMDLREILKADAIVSGQVISFDVLETMKGHDRPVKADIVVSTYATLSGPSHSNRTEFLWENRTNGIDDSLPNRETMIFVLQSVNDGGLRILHPACGSAYVFKFDSPAGRAIEMIFDGKGDPVAEAELFAEYLHLDGNPIY